MNILINCEKNTFLKLPVKFVDYCSTGRKVFTFESGRISDGKTQPFLDGGYIGKYNFKNMHRQFLMLNEKKDSE